MPLALQSNPFALVLQNLVARVASALSVDTAFVRPVASDDYEVTIAEPLFAYIRSYGPQPCDPSTGQPFGDYGAGRWGRVVARRIRVYIYTRSGTDVYGGDETALMGSDPSQTILVPSTVVNQFLAEDFVLNAIDDFSPLTTDGATPLTIGPVHWIPEGGPPVRKPEDDVGLVRSNLDFSICYIQPQVAVEPAPPVLGDAVEN